MKEKSVAIFVVTVLIIIALAAVAGFGIPDVMGIKVPSVLDKTESNDNYGIRQGLDLVGGSRIVFEAQAENPSSDEMSTAVSMLKARLDTLGYTEATTVKQGNKRIVVEIPAISNPEDAVQKLGATAKLTFTDADGNVVMEGSDIKSAKAAYEATDSTGKQQHIVKLELKSEAVSKFAEATRAAAARSGEQKNYISIRLDENEISSPRVNEEINSSECIIEGSFDAEKAKYLAGVIQAGQLPFGLDDVELRSVGPTLGERVLDTSLLAGAIGILLVMLFMLLVYRLPGLVADIALLAYMAIVGIIFAILKVNLSLSGIAGIILSIGMAVDANVVIFERVKEELRNGKTIRASVDSGFHRALTAIIDANVTTMIAAVVLYIFGMGTIKGFALTLGIGIIVSMFTAIVVTRLLLKQLVGMGVTSPWAFGVKGRKADV